MAAVAVRVLALLAAASLAACASSSQEESLSAAAAAPAPPPVGPRPTAQGRNMFAPPPPAPQVVAQAPGLTVEKARGECWMQLDRDKKTARDLDKRVKLVEACVEAKMSAPPPQ
jgi:hypothetical protein